MSESEEKRQPKRRAGSPAVGDVVPAKRIKWSHSHFDTMGLICGPSKRFYPRGSKEWNLWNWFSDPTLKWVLCRTDHGVLCCKLGHVSSDQGQHVWTDGNNRVVYRERDADEAMVNETDSDYEERKASDPSFVPETLGMCPKGNYAVIKPGPAYADCDHGVHGFQTVWIVFRLLTECNGAPRIAGEVEYRGHRAEVYREDQDWLALDPQKDSVDTIKRSMECAQLPAVLLNLVMEFCIFPSGARAKAKELGKAWARSLAAFEVLA